MERDTPLYLYLMDHGDMDRFLIHGDQTPVTASDLNGWLDELEANLGADNINVIIETCRSGSFIDVTPAGLGEISKVGRVVIASTSSEQSAYASPTCAYFSDAFFSALNNSQDLWTSFQAGNDAVRSVWPPLPQTPWLDDNGNTRANDSADGLLARGRGLAFEPPFDQRSPVIEVVSVPSDIPGPAATIRVRARDNVRVAGVYVVIFAPSFVAPGEITPDLGAPFRELMPQGDDEYAASYDGFTERGEYRLMVYARDDDGNQAFPQSARIWVGTRLWLPLVMQ
jgi:hypothetical protein